MGTSRNKPFRFENVWLSHPDFTNTIDKWWMEDMPVQGTKMFMLQERLKHIKSRLNDWTKKSLVIFLKPKEKLNKNSKGLIRSSSQMVLPRKGKLKPILFRRNGKIGACKRRFSGDINREYSGLEKGKETKSFFINKL